MLDIKPTKVSRVVSPRVFTGKHERHRVAIPRRADHEIPRELHTQGADVPRVCESSMKGSTMLPEESQIRCEDKIEKQIARTRSRRISPRRTRSRNTKLRIPQLPQYCVTLQCCGMISVFSQRAKMTFVDEQDRKYFQFFNLIQSLICSKDNHTSIL